MNRKKVTASQLRELLSYDEKTGIFVWLVNRRRVRAGTIAGCLNQDGYRALCVMGKLYLAHRLAWLYVYGEWPKNVIDHIDGIQLNNAISNLRDVSITVNNQNQRKAQRHNKSSGFLGVSANVRNKQNPYRARIADGYGKQIHIGFFSTPQLAHAAYVEAKRAMQPGCQI